MCGTKKNSEPKEARTGTGGGFNERQSRYDFLIWHIHLPTLELPVTYIDSFITLHDSLPFQKFLCVSAVMTGGNMWRMMKTSTMTSVARRKSFGSRGARALSYHQHPVTKAVGMALQTTEETAMRMQRLNPGDQKTFRNGGRNHPVLPHVLLHEDQGACLLMKIETVCVI